VCSARAFAWARIVVSGGGHKGSSDLGTQLLSVIACILSLLCGSVNLAWDGALEEMKLRVYDTVAYMSILAFLFKHEGLVVGIVIKLKLGLQPKPFGEACYAFWQGGDCINTMSLQATKSFRR